MGSPAVDHFLARADAVLGRLAAAGRAGPSPSGVNLAAMAADIQRMRRAAAQDEMPPRHLRYRNLTRIIVDQWPLADPLGALIAELEDQYIRL